MSWPGQAPEHETDHGETDESGDGSSVALEIACQAPMATDPGERTLDDPAFGKNDETMQLIAFDDFELPGAGACDDRRRFWSLVAGIGEDTLEEREETARTPIENEPRAVAILHVGRMNNDIQQETERIDENVPLAARDLLARIEALWVKRGAPF